MSEQEIADALELALLSLDPDAVPEVDPNWVEPEPVEQVAGQADMHAQPPGVVPAVVNPIQVILETFIASPEFQTTFPIHAVINQDPDQPFEIKNGYYTIRVEADSDWVELCGLSWTAEGAAAIQEVIPEDHPHPTMTAMIRCRGNREAADHLPHFVNISTLDESRMELWWLPNDPVILDLPAGDDVGTCRPGNVHHNLHSAIPDLAAILDVYDRTISI